MFEYAETWGPHMKRILFILAIVLSPLWGSSGQSASPLRETMESYVESRVIAGSVTIIASKDRVLSCEAVGHADIATQEVMRPDHLFWIASMTKPLTAVCVMQLQDEGLLTIDDPVAKHLPEFQGQWKIQSTGQGATPAHSSAPRDNDPRPADPHIGAVRHRDAPQREHACGTRRTLFENAFVF